MPEKFEVVSSFRGDKHYVDGPWNELSEEDMPDGVVDGVGWEFGDYKEAAVEASRLNIKIKRGGI